MELVTDPQETRRLAEDLLDENWAFRAWIKGHLGLTDRELMAVVHWLAEEVTAQIDCTTCANCCRVLAPSVNQEEMQRLAKALGLDVPALQETHLRQDERGKWELPAPCPLLDGKLCRVYEARPKACRDYPHLHNDFRSRSMARIHDTFVCPIVFNVVEGMKIELDWFDSDEESDWFDWQSLGHSHKVKRSSCWQCRGIPVR